MPNNLQQYFPMIRTKEEILSEIENNRKLSARFYGWSLQQREEFLSFCAGVKGVKVLYDSFSKEILNPEKAPERLEDLLSLLIRKNVRILCALPNDSTRIADENTLVVTDIVVELEDGSIANIEIQKIGYKFPGERCACYSADMLLRQYKRVRSARKKGFSYEDVKNVYTIVLFEQSPEPFQMFRDTYVHYFEQCSDSGLELELLQKYIFIPLDIFRKNHYNKTIESRLEAWLTFFSEDNPERIIELISSYPEFKFMYEDIYRICCNMEEVMGIFSEELRILDRNTVQLMIDEMQDELNTLNQQRDTLSAERDTLSAERDTLSAECNTLSAERDMLSAERDTLSAERDTLSAECNTLSAERDTLSAERDTLSRERDHLHVELERMKQLNRALAGQGRTEDIIKAATNEACREQLYKELGIC